MTAEGTLPLVLGRALQSGCLPHALLFSGAAGLGKGEAAAAVARALVCQAAGAGAVGGCGACLDCRQAGAGTHPDVRWVTPAGGSIRIDQVREVVREAHLRPFRGRGRVFVFRDAERMTEEAANSLLKVLEEPPAQTRFILLTAVPGALLPTVRSRCQEVVFRPLPEEAVAAALVGEGALEEEALRVARLTGGNPGLARRLLGSPELRRAVELGRRALMVVGAPDLDPGELFSLAQELDALEAAFQDGQAGCSPLDVLAWALRDALVAALAGGEDLAGTPSALLRSLRTLQLARRALATGGSRRLAFEVLLIKLRGVVNGSYNFDELSRLSVLMSG